MKRKLLAGLLLLAMVLALVPGPALAAETNDFLEMTIDGQVTPYSDQMAFLTALTNAADKTITIKLLDNIQVSGSVPIAKGQTVTLDMNGKSITVPDNFSGRPIVNEGTLTVTGNGVIDSSMSASGGYGAINNKGTLTIENGTFRGATSASGSAIRNTGKDAVLTIRGGTFDTATCAVFNEGTATIHGGTFTGTTCSMCNSNLWSYTIRNYDTNSKMYIYGGTFTGVQGAVSASVGTLEIYGGNFKTVGCPTHGTQATFYALYAAGEVGKVQCIIHDGTFETEGNYTAVLIGNDNTGGDGGVNEKATATVYGGIFTAPSGVPALKISEKTAATSILHGGTYSQLEDAIDKYIDPASKKDESSGNVVIAPRTEQDPDTVAMVDKKDAGGAACYPTLQGAIHASQTGDTVKLLQSCTGLTTIAIENDKKLTLDLNGHSLTFAADNGFVVRGGALELIGSGTVSSSYGSKYLPTIYAYGSSTDQADYSVVTVGKDVTVKNEGSYALAIGHSAYKAYGAKVIVAGRVASTYGLTVTGNAQATDGNVPEFTLTETGSMVCTGGSPLYAAGYAKYQLAGKLSGTETGIEIRAGELTVEEGAEITASSAFSDPRPNGNGSTVVGVALAVSQHTTNLPITVTVKGGTFTATGPNGYALYEIDTVPDEPAEQVAKHVKISVAGGCFSGGVFSTNDKLSLSAGYFTSDVSRYCVPGTACSENTDGNSSTYPYQVKDAALPPQLAGSVESATATGDTDASIDSAHVAPADQKAATAVAGSVTPASSGGNTLANASPVAQDVQDAQKAAAIRELARAGIITVDNETGNITSGGVAAKVSIVREDYLTVTVTAFTNSAQGKSFTLDIKPLYNLKATTADLNNEGSMTPGNTVTLATAQPLTVTEGKAVDITIPLPTGFAEAGSTVFVTHKKEDGRVFKTECTVEQAASGLSILFTNRNGFSAFTVSLPAAQVGTTNYATLQDAVNAVPDGGTITLQNSVTEEVTVSRTVSFTLDLNGKTFTGAITAAGSNTTAGAGNPPRNQGGLFSFVYSAPSHGSSQRTYEVVVPSAVANGVVTVRPSRAEKGDTVTILLTPDEGCELEELLVTDKNGDGILLKDKGGGKYTFTMPASKVTVAVSFSKRLDPVTGCPQGGTCPAVAFDDISAGAWYHDGVHYCVAEALMNGVSGRRFAPDASLSRAMLVTVLYRMEGSPSVGRPTFADVPAGLWYSDAVAWAAECGVVNGVGDNRFAPERDISRQDMAVTLYRYASYKGYDMTNLADLSTYHDSGRIAPYARAAVEWCVAGGIISGKPGDLLDPSGSATRAEVASVLLRYCSAIKK